MKSNAGKILLFVFIGLILIVFTFSAGLWTGSMITSGGKNPALTLQLPGVPTQEIQSQSTSAPIDREALFFPFWQAWDTVHRDFVDQPVDDVILMQGAIRGMLSSLGDPHTSYMDQSEFQQANAPLEGEYEGIGAYVDTTGDFLTIISPMAGSPAEKAGLKPGDTVIAIDNEDMTGIDPNLVLRKIPIAVAEAFERGLTRREKEKKDISTMGSVCTLMVGRLDDWLKVVAEKRGVIANPWVFDWAGVAVMKKAYKLYQQRGYRLRLLSAAFRNHLHWSEFIGGDVVISPPYEWQVKYNASDVTIENRMQIDVDPAIVDELDRKFVDFHRSYIEDGMMNAEFDDYGPTRRTLRQFSKATEDLSSLVRDVIIPNPDV